MEEGQESEAKLEEAEKGKAKYVPVKTAPRGEILAWAMYDFANSAYTTIVTTAIFNPYFVKVVAGPGSGLEAGKGTFILTVSLCISSLAIVLSAPVVGTIVDALAKKKRVLFCATILCITCTSLLSQIGKGDYVFGLILLTLANFAYGTAEDIIAAFLPELAAREDMGKVSAFGWTIGYIGGLAALAICIAYVSYATKMQMKPEQYVPVTMLITAAFYGVGALPSFIFLKERGIPEPNIKPSEFLFVGFRRLRKTLIHAIHYQDLFRFLISLFVFSCGSSTVIGLASVYAEEVMGFTPRDSLMMLFAVNITAAVGAFNIGYVQDKIGSIRTVGFALCLWIIATAGAYACTNRVIFWILACIIGLALGASGSSGRALVGLFSPPGRSGEFFGLWGLAGKLAAAVGPLTFGLVTLGTHNYRLALLSSTSFFIIGLLLLFLVNENRGKEAAHARVNDDDQTN